MPDEGKNGQGLPEACQLHVTQVERRMTLIEARLDDHESKIGGTFREASAAHEIGKKVFDAIEVLKKDVTDGFREMADSQTRACDIRHRPIDRSMDGLERRVVKLEDADDDPTLTATSGLLLAQTDPEEAARQHQQMKERIEALEKARLEEQARREAKEQLHLEEKARREAATKKLEEETKAKSEAEANLVIANAHAKKMTITAYASAIVVVLGGLVYVVEHLLLR